MSQRRTPKRRAAKTDQKAQAVAIAWLVLGLGCSFFALFSATSTKLQKPVALVAIYVLAVLGLDLFVGASRRVTLQRIAPAVVLAAMVTPGVPASVGLIADLLGTLALSAVSRPSWELAQRAGRALLPAGATALFLATRNVLDLDAYFFATEVFLVVSLLTRASDEPFRSDLFLVVSYPAIALMLRSLAELHLAYVLLAVPLLFLLTTVDTEMLLRYFQLQKKLDDTQLAIKETKKAQRQTELENRRQGVLLTRKELQLSLLNGLGRELDAADATEDLARFLLKESMRLTGIETSLALFFEGRGQITKVVSPVPRAYWGLKEGDYLPRPLQPGTGDVAPWRAPVWQEQKSFLVCELGREGWMVLASPEKGAFPEFLEEFFSAVGRHAGSALLALRRLVDVREIAQREAKEKERVATEKEKVAEQNRNLRLLIENFEGLTEEALTADHELLRQATLAVKRITRADVVIFQAPEFSSLQRDEQGWLMEGGRWADVLHVAGTGPSGNLLALSREPGLFSEGHLEWCTLLRDFLDKTMENAGLHREVQASYAQLEVTQAEVVRSSQWAAAGRLAANAAHELNTPLGAIRLAAEQAGFFLKSETTPEPVLQGLQSIMRSVDRCRAVTDRLLITSRPVDQGDVPTSPESHALRPIVADAVDSVRPYLRASNILLAEHRLMGDFKVKVVLQDLYWAVVNVLKNGIDALNDSDIPKKQIAVALHGKDGWVEIHVADNGPGVPPELQQKIFEPFFTTKKLGQGNGLGLSLSLTNLRKWGGDLDLVETPGGGATFIISVPLTK